MTKHLFPLGLSLSLLGGVFPYVACADQAEEILNLRARNRDRVQRFSADVRQEVHRPPAVQDGGPRDIIVLTRIRLEKLSPSVVARSSNPWRIEIDYVSPAAPTIRIEGEQVWKLSRQKQWMEVKMKPALRRFLASQAEWSLGTAFLGQRDRFSVKLIAPRNPVAKSKLSTWEFVSKVQGVRFHRVEEDVNADGLPLAVRMFSEMGNEMLANRVVKHRKIHGVPVIEEMEAVNQIPSGDVVTRTVFTNLRLELSK